MKYSIILVMILLSLINFELFAQQEDEENKLKHCKYLLETGRYDEALKEVSSIIELNPGSKEANTFLGLVYYEKGQLDKALEVFKKESELYPEDKIIISNLGNTYTDLKMYDEAIAVLKKGVEIDSGDAKAFINLGTAYAEKGNTEEAIVQFRKSVSLNPNNPLARYNLGYSYYKTQKWNEAIDELICLRFIDQWYPGVEETLKLTLHKAFQYLEKQAKDKPDDPMAHYYYAYALLYELKYEKAEEEINKAIKIDETKGIYYAAKDLIISSGAANSNDEEFEKEINILTNCIKKAPECWECYWQLGNVYIAMGNFQKALTPLQNAYRINSENINVCSYLGVAYVNTKQNEKAIDVFKKAIKLGTKDPGTFLNIAKTYYFMKNYDLAWYWAKLAQNKGYGEAKQFIEVLKSVSKEPK